MNPHSMQYSKRQVDNEERGKAASAKESRRLHELNLRHTVHNQRKQALYPATSPSDVLAGYADSQNRRYQWSHQMSHQTVHHPKPPEVNVGSLGRQID